MNTSLSLAYTYSHDQTGGAYGDVWRSPHGTEDGELTFSIRQASTVEKIPNEWKFPFNTLTPHQLEWK